MSFNKIHLYTIRLNHCFLLLDRNRVSYPQLPFSAILVVSDRVSVLLIN